MAEQGIGLEVIEGDAAVLMPALARRAGADAVYWNRRYAPGERLVDEGVSAAIQAEGLKAETFTGNVLAEPWEIATQQGKPYSVFTPFFRALRSRSVAVPLQAPTAGSPRAARTVDEGYREPHWAGKLARHCQPGETTAQAALERFLAEKLTAYALGRDVPSQSATSQLSPRLRHGEISPRQVWHAALAAAQQERGLHDAVEKFLSELAWRDFSYHQLYHRADIATEPMQPKYGGLRWREAADDLFAWQQGRTGIPMVDAGMREMWETGFMQNRVRMLTASFLTKNLLIDWRIGERWFWDCLVDADVANNPASWQWIAGSGLDATPYFRIFNPVTQGERFDPDGGYVRRWVPELAALPDKWVHRPHEAPADVLRKAGLTPGESYPRPIVDLGTSRQRALAAAADLRNDVPQS